MPRKCVVPGCETKKQEANCSLFSVPKEEVLRNEWIKAIPGITSLKGTEIICEKHFSGQCVVKVFTKKDADGNIPAETNYQRLLRKDSVPTIFNNYDMPSLLQEKNAEAKPATIKNSSESESLKSLNRDFVRDLRASVIKKLAVNQNGDKNRVFQLMKLEDYKNLRKSSKKIVKPLKTKAAEKAPKIKILQNVAVNDSPPKESACNTVPHISGNNVIKQIAITNSDIQTNLAANTLRTYSGKKRSFVMRKDVPVVTKKYIPTEKDVNAVEKDVTRVFKSLSEAYSVEHDYSLHKAPRPSFYTNTINIDPKSVELPKTWGVTEKTIHSEKYLLFAKLITQTVGEREVEVLEKYLLLNCSKNSARYFVYGHEIKEVALLPDVILTTDILLRSLNIFEAMQVCRGLGFTDTSYVRKDEVLKDSVNSLRHFNCPWLLMRTKKCIFCKKLRRLVSRRKLRSPRSANKDTVSKETYKKLKKQLYNEKRLRRIAIERKKTLAKNLSDKKKVIEALINYNESFENICVQHDVLNNHKLALKEILEASKVNPHGRRYSDEWLMFCTLITIRSPSTYEFLRKTNVIPLPTMRTVRRYFYGKNMRRNFDETFLDLMKKCKDENTKQVSENSMYQNSGDFVLQLDER